MGCSCGCCCREGVPAPTLPPTCCCIACWAAAAELATCCGVTLNWEAAKVKRGLSWAWAWAWAAAMAWA